jgi:hypothetical protein
VFSVLLRETVDDGKDIDSVEVAIDSDVIDSLLD